MREKMRIFRGNVEYVYTTLILPKEIRNRAKELRINMGDALIDGLIMKFNELETKCTEEVHESQGDTET